MTKTVNLLENGEKSWGELLTYNFSSRNKTKQTNKQTKKVILTVSCEKKVFNQKQREKTKKKRLINW